jgi:hypothetical protein
MEILCPKMPQLNHKSGVINSKQGKVCVSIFFYSQLIGK